MHFKLQFILSLFLRYSKFHFIINKINELLKSHTSTKERLAFYPKFKNIVKKINPNSILDLGCGLNPIALSNFFPNTFYYAYDIKKEDILLVEKFFKKNNINGKLFIADIRKVENFPKADLTLILKTLDIIDTKNHFISKSILKNIECKYFIISFSTHTLSGKPMNFPRRAWFENILKELNFKFAIIKSKNEVFYVAEKNKLTSLELSTRKL